ncbi:spore coat polysaccharide biosynthesis protein SpsF (cytidylyltransferase family) [Pontibacter aydingkolensis]|uniref:Glycosyltransferase family protein n=1 Tax=Pontibacter aydingkolensis TaxID=1911536 RepID=A0ABS7CVR0_9BACT|nr:glycosyltransferase family protein [Pontibacter aydingkolensis]MBW7467887.1 glycosyltransferase family protein [Pontibacter aydingkolensis]
MVKVGAIIQARLGSERLPNKALLPLPFSGGPTLLQHVISRAKAAQSLATIIIATTEKTADDAIHTFCQDNQTDCFRGSENDVLERFYTTAQKYKLNVVVRLTGDNPFIMPATIDEAVAKHLAAGVDYTITEGLPLGTNIEVLSFSALERAAREATAEADHEHVTPYIRREQGFKRQSINYTSALSSLRLTVDYPSDYALANLLYDRLYHQNKLFSFADIEKLLQEHGWLVSVNTQNQQRQAFATEEEEFAVAAKALQEGGYARVLQKLQEVLK